MADFQQAAVLQSRAIDALNFIEQNKGKFLENGLSDEDKADLGSIANFARQASADIYNNNSEALEEEDLKDLSNIAKNEDLKNLSNLSNNSNNVFNKDDEEQITKTSAKVDGSNIEAQQAESALNTAEQLNNKVSKNIKKEPEQIETEQGIVGIANSVFNVLVNAVKKLANALVRVVAFAVNQTLGRFTGNHLNADKYTLKMNKGKVHKEGDGVNFGDNADKIKENKLHFMDSKQTRLQKEFFNAIEEGDNPAKVLNKFLQEDNNTKPEFNLHSYNTKYYKENCSMSDLMVLTKQDNFDLEDKDTKKNIDKKLKSNKGYKADLKTLRKQQDKIILVNNLLKHNKEFKEEFENSEAAQKEFSDFKEEFKDNVDSFKKMNDTLKNNEATSERYTNSTNKEIDKMQELVGAKNEQEQGQGQNMENSQQANKSNKRSLSPS